MCHVCSGLCVDETADQLACSIQNSEEVLLTIASISTDFQDEPIKVIGNELIHAYI